MGESFENIIKSQLENYRPKAPDAVLDSLRTHYPKPSAGDFISLHVSKIVLVAAIAIVGVVALIVMNNKEPKQNELEVSEIRYIERIDVDLSYKQIAPNKNRVAVVNRKLANNNTQVYNNSYKNAVGYFVNIDTIVCGNSFELNIAGENPEYFSAAGLELEYYQGLLRVHSKKPGVYYLKYQNTQNQIQVLDSMKLCFADVPKPIISVQQDTKCDGNSVIVHVENASGKTLKWSVPGAEVLEIGNNNYRLVFKSSSNSNVRVVLTSVGIHCSCSESLLLQIPQKVEVKAVVQPATCNLSNGKVKIVSNRNDATFILDGNIKNQSGEFENLSAGEHSVVMIYNGSCVETIDFEIPENQKLVASFNYQFDRTNPTKIQFTNRTVIDSRSYNRFGDMSFEWFIENERFYSENPDYEFLTYGAQQIMLVASYGQSCTDTFVNTVYVANENLLIPNLFSPNGDGISDVFTVKVDNPVRFQATITNTRGEVLYRWTDAAGGWDGRINGNNLAAEGVYFYIISAEFESGNVVQRKGTLTLVRD